MDPGDDALTRFLLSYLMHSTLLIGGAWLVLRVLPLRANPLRERIWSCALALGVLTAAWQTYSGIDPLGPVVNVRRAARAPAATAAPETNAEKDEVASAATRERTTTIEAAREPEQERPRVDRDASGTATGTRSSTHVAVRPPAFVVVPGSRAVLRAPSRAAGGRAGANAARAREVPAGIAGSGAPDGMNTAVVRVIWSAGALAFLACVALGILRFAAGRRHRRLVTDGSLRRRLDRLERRSGLRGVRLFVDDEAAVPVAFGLLRPSIAVPARVLDELDPSLQDALLAHELAHLVRRDPLRLFFCRVLESVFFFQPLNRLARRRLFDEAEFRCDALAVRLTGQGLQLAACLAQVADWLRSDPRSLLEPAPVAMARLGSPLARRIVRLLDDQEALELDRPRRLHALAFVLLIPAFAFGAPAVRTIEAPPSGSPAHAALSSERSQSVDPARPSAGSEPAGAPVALAPRGDAPAGPERRVTPVGVIAASAATAASDDPVRAALRLLDEDMTVLVAEVDLLRQEVHGTRIESALLADLARLEERIENIQRARERLLSMLSMPSQEPGLTPDAEPLPSSSPRRKTP